MTSNLARTRPRRGTLPVILSAPHGGRLAIAGCPERAGGPGVTQFVTVTDASTDRLAEAIAAALERRTGKPPHLVVARFGRRYADANRPAADGTEHPLARVQHDAYHAHLKRARDRVAKAFGRGLLVDIHGQAADPNAIFRGTRNGKTVAHLIDRFGPAARVGPDGLLGRIAAKGYTVVPAVGSADAEDRRFGGGHAVGTYGSKDGGGADAIQLEAGATHRAAKAIDNVAADFAEAVAGYAAAYLPATPAR